MKTLNYLAEILILNVALYVGVLLFVATVLVLNFCVGLPSPSSFEEVATLAKVILVPCGAASLLLYVLG